MVSLSRIAEPAAQQRVGLPVLTKNLGSSVVGTFDKTDPSIGITMDNITNTIPRPNVISTHKGGVHG